jgi:hypothetical protein
MAGHMQPHWSDMGSCLYGKRCASPGGAVDGALGDSADAHLPFMAQRSCRSLGPRTSGASWTMRRWWCSTVLRRCVALVNHPRSLIPGDLRRVHHARGGVQADNTYTPRTLFLVMQETPDKGLPPPAAKKTTTTAAAAKKPAAAKPAGGSCLHAHGSSWQGVLECACNSIGLP